MDSPGFLYAIAASGTSLVKIGMTTQPIRKRLRGLQTAHPFPLEIIAVIPIRKYLRHVEYYMHKKLQYAHKGGEWFEINITKEDFALYAEEAIRNTTSMFEQGFLFPITSEYMLNDGKDNSISKSAIQIVIDNLRIKVKKCLKNTSILQVSKTTGISRNVIADFLNEKHVGLSTILKIEQWHNSQPGESV